jgi:uncharacterized membrane protein YczE
MAIALPDRFPERLARCVAGLAVFGLGISLIITAHLGLAPWDVFHQGLSNHTGIGIGWWIEIVGIIILILSWAFLGQRPGLGTIINAIEIGLVVALIGDHLPHTDRLVPRVACVRAGIVAIGIGSGLYIGSGLGAGPRDGLMMGLAQRRVSVRVARTVIEASALAIGLVLGGSIGFGTVAFTLGIGPLVHFWMPRLRMRGAAAAEHLAAAR